MRTFFYRLCGLEAEECGYGGPEGHIAGLGDGYLSAVCCCIRGEVYGVGGGAPACGYPVCVGIDAAHDYLAAVHGEGHSHAVNLYLSGRHGGGGAKGVAADVPQRRTGVAGGGGGRGSVARGRVGAATDDLVNEIQVKCRIDVYLCRILMLLWCLGLYEYAIDYNKKQDCGNIYTAVLL